MRQNSSRSIEVLPTSEPSGNEGAEESWTFSRWATQIADELDIEIDDVLIKGTVVQKPFFDPKKEITKKSL